MPAAQPHTGHRGNALLLAHCVSLGRLDHPQSSPLVRLAAVVGPDLAYVLVHGLASGPRRAHDA
jgi:hypothetical protein